MHEGNDLEVFHSRTPLSDFLNTTTRLSTLTNVGHGEPGMIPLDQPGETEARRILNRVTRLSCAPDVEWGGSSRSGPVVPDNAMKQRYLEAIRPRSRTSPAPSTRAVASAPLALPLRR